MSHPPELLKNHLEKEKEKMFRIAWKMCGNPDDAEEVLQETAVKALKNWHQFRGEAMISTWLYRIASNTCLSKKRRKTTEPIDPGVLEGIPRNVEDEGLPIISDWSSDPMMNTLNNELRETLDRAIFKLPDIYRIVFLMRDIEGMTIEETSKALNITASNVKVRLHRARMFLRDELSEYFSALKGQNNEHEEKP